MTNQEPNPPAPTATGMIVDDMYKFSAPCFFDFIKDESEDDRRKAELWFNCALTCALSRKQEAKAHSKEFLTYCG
ncbi:protein TPX2 [Pyrus ussuriensis x Pyrus communis]|uniref:Protein TPX2 n=1 Tax=Pyrus ussuriensis x Pyrus communis TaxID=2448454 RepID=A0A5N5I2Q7_9ROSA|nr:protein TPX2 [Pyrus ussuriensis x Pyrus communis]